MMLNVFGTAWLGSGQSTLKQEQAEADEKSKELHGPNGIAQRKAKRRRAMRNGFVHIWLWVKGPPVA